MVHQRSIAIGTSITIIMTAMVVVLLSLSASEQWPVALLVLTCVVALMLLTLRVNSDDPDKRAPHEMELFSGPTIDGEEEQWSVDEEDLPAIDEGDLSGIWSGTVRFGGRGVGAMKLIEELANAGAPTGHASGMDGSVDQKIVSGSDADERRIVPLRVALSEYPATVRLLPSEHFSGRDRVVAVDVIEHDAVYAALHLRVSVVRADQPHATVFDAGLSYGGLRAPKLTPTDETTTYTVELRRTHHFRVGLDGRRLTSASLLAAPLSKLHPLAS